MGNKFREGFKFDGFLGQMLLEGLIHRLDIYQLYGFLIFFICITWSEFQKDKNVCSRD